MLRIGERDLDWLTPGDLLVAKARQFGDAVFATVDGTALSYSGLERASWRMAINLVARGICKGDRVATFMYNCPEQLISMFAVMRAGAIWTPINAGLVGNDLAYTLQDSGAGLLIVDRENYPKIAGLPPALREQVQIVVTEAGERKYDDDAFERLLAEPGDDDVLPEVSAADPGVILYTGGTTGLPKGVVLTQLSFVLSGIRYGEVYATRPGERHFTTLPLFHAGALQFAVMGPLATDMSTVIDRRFSVTSYWARVCETKANVIDPIGSMLTLLCRQPESELDRAHSVRIGIGIFGQVPAEVPTQFSSRFGVPLVSIYGLTEAGGAMITSNRLDDLVPGSNGRTYGWAELRICDENDQPVPVGEVGQILLRPTYPHMFMLGYHNNPQKSLESFRNLWLQTGDLGWVDASGNLFYVGRKAQWIRRRGENISAFEIESILLSMPGISEAVVVGVESDLGEDEVKAFVILEKPRSIEPEAIVRWCQDRMAPFKVPRYVALLEDFPRSVTKREVERSVLKRLPNNGVWDREKVMGRLSSQARAAGAATAKG